jgi:hypothetical protein
MHERLLQFIWQHRYYSAASLHTTAGEPLHIARRGTFNIHQGPDFLDAFICIRDTLWAGHIEIHVRSSDWLRHGHDNDPRYGNIILHVVWEDDHDLTRLFPVLELRPLVPKWLLNRYAGLMEQLSAVPCHQQIHTISLLTWESWKNRLMIERLQQKSAKLIHCFEQCGHDWEETAWRQLAAGFGMPVNAEAFGELASLLPLKVLLRQRDQLEQLEALLLGCSGLLKGPPPDAYTRNLLREYRFLRRKFGLPVSVIRLQLLRMRPAGFPPVRLAQLAMLIHTRGSLFAWLLQLPASQAGLQALQVKAAGYWDTHYLPGVSAGLQVKRVGKQMAVNLVVNTVAPLLFAYGSYCGNTAMKEKSVQWLELLPAENDRITRQFSTAGMLLQSAACTQAVQQLFRHYCSEKRCLDCAVGNALLGKKAAGDQL